jgi:hypothetical protein
MGKAFVYALDGIISLYSCIRYVSFCITFKKLLGQADLRASMFGFSILER